MGPLALAYLVATINILIVALAVALAGAVFVVVKKTIYNEMNRMSSILPGALETLSYAEVPIQVVAVIALHMNMKLEDVVKEYKKDAVNRRTIVLQTFRRDAVTLSFVDSFRSKFIQHGYVGEDLLTQ